MSILKRKVNNKRTRKSVGFLGVYVPKKLSSYITLYTLYHGETKSSLITSLLRRWERKMMENFPEEVLAKEVAMKAFNLWDNPDGKRENFPTFIKSLRIELKNKGVEPVLVARIIQIIEDAKEKKDNK